MRRPVRTVCAVWVMGKGGVKKKKEEKKDTNETRGRGVSMWGRGEVLERDVWFDASLWSVPRGPMRAAVRRADCCGQGGIV